MIFDVLVLLLAWQQWSAAIDISGPDQCRANEKHNTCMHKYIDLLSFILTLCRDVLYVTIKL